MGKYGDDIRRIARVKDTKDPNIGSTDVKGDLDPVRGVAYFDSAGVLKTASTTPGAANPFEDIQSNLQVGVSDALAQAEAEAAAEDANNKFKPGGGSSNQTPVDFADLIDGTSQAAISDDFSLTEINGVSDIATGDDILIRMDGTYRAPDATPPWERWDEPPASLKWVSGAWFSSSGVTSNNYGVVMDAAITSSPEALQFDGWYAGAVTGPPNSADLATLPTGSNSNIVYEFYVTRLGGGSPFLLNFSMFRCDGTAFGDPSYGRPSSCGLNGGNESRYPDGHTTTLSLAADGLFKSAALDFSKIGRAYKAGVSTLVFKFDGGTRFGVIEPGAGNTKLVYEVDGSGTAIGTVYKYTMGKVDYTQNYSFITKPRTLVDKFAASNISQHRLPSSNTSFIRLGGIYPP